MKGIAKYWLSPGWKMVPALLGLLGIGGAFWCGSEQRLYSLVFLAAGLAAAGFADGIAERLAGSTRGEKAPEAGLSTWLVFVLLVFLGGAYVLGTIVLAPRGLDLLVSDVIAGALFLAIGFAIKKGRARLWWMGLAVGLMGGIVAFPLLPRDTALAGIERPIEGAEAEVTWFIDGAHALVDNPVDYALEYNNDRVIEWTTRLKWQKLNDARIKTLRGARAQGVTCLGLAEEMGEDGLVEGLSWIEEGKTPDLEALFDCPVPARHKLKQKLEDRLAARNEETAADEMLASAHPDGALARARLALQIYPRALFARAVAGDCLLSRGIRLMRTGESGRAMEDLEEAIRLLDDESNRGRAYLALGRAHKSAGHKHRARNAFSRALVTAPGTATARTAERAMRPDK